MHIRACSSCASRDLAPPTLGQGLIPGGTETLEYVCASCGQHGMPLEFDSKEDYRAFKESKERPEATPQERLLGPEEPPSRRDARREAGLLARPRERDIFDKLRIMPLMALAIGAVLLAYGGLGVIGAVLALASTLNPLALVALVWPAIIAIVGLAFLNIGRRAWAKAA